MRWLILSLLALAAPAAANPRDWVAANRQAILDEYLPLLAIPNVASNRADIRRNADHIVAMMQRRGLNPAPARKRGRPGAAARSTANGSSPARRGPTSSTPIMTASR